MPPWILPHIGRASLSSLTSPLLKTWKGVIDGSGVQHGGAWSTIDGTLKTSLLQTQEGMKKNEFAHY